MGLKPGSPGPGCGSCPVAGRSVGSSGIMTTGGVSFSAVEGELTGVGGGGSGDGLARSGSCCLVAVFSLLEYVRMEFGAGTAVGLEAATGLCSPVPAATARRLKAGMIVAMQRQPTVAQNPMPGDTSSAPVRTSGPAPFGTGSSLDPMKSIAEQNSPQTAETAAANRAHRRGNKEKISPVNTRVKSAIACGLRALSGAAVATIGSGVSALVVPPFLFCRKCRALAVGSCASLVAGDPTSPSSTGGVTTLSVRAYSTCPRSIPRTSSMPLIGLGSRPPTRTLKKTSMKHPAASAKAIAAVHTGKLFPADPADVRMFTDKVVRFER